MSTRLERIRRILARETTGGIVLIVCAAVALAWASSAWRNSYHALWHAAPAITVFGRRFAWPLHAWVNDGLMTLFFFVVGLEIRREMDRGSLADVRAAALPVIAALGGMIVPALLYLSIAGAAATRSGWGIPTATDIAFAIGVLALLGRRVSPSLRILLLAIAIVDDVGAIVIIAVFYGHGIVWTGFGIAAAGVGLILVLQWRSIARPIAYFVPAFIVWFGALKSGVHPTLAGVVVGLLTPARATSSHPAPLDRLIVAFSPFVTYVVMPVFALANAGIALDTISLHGNDAKIALGIFVGLVIGKPLGIVASTLLALRFGFARAPDGIRTRDVLLVGIVAGIGFTMSIFISQLAFVDADTIATAKASVLAGSCIAALAALVYGRSAVTSLDQR